MPPGGPFSTFPGVDRYLLLLSGRARVAVGGAPWTTLVAGSDTLLGPFPADGPGVTRSVVEEAGLDLNVMWDRTTVCAEVAVARRDAVVRLDADTTILVALQPETRLHTSQGDELALGFLDGLQVDVDVEGSTPALMARVANGRVLVAKLMGLGDHGGELSSGTSAGA